MHHNLVHLGGDGKTHLRSFAGEQLEAGGCRPNGKRLEAADGGWGEAIGPRGLPGEGSAAAEDPLAEAAGGGRDCARQRLPRDRPPQIGRAHV